MHSEECRTFLWRAVRLNGESEKERERVINIYPVKDILLIKVLCHIWYIQHSAKSISWRVLQLHVLLSNASGLFIKMLQHSKENLDSFESSSWSLQGKIITMPSLFVKNTREILISFSCTITPLIKWMGGNRKNAAHLHFLYLWCVWQKKNNQLIINVDSYKYLSEGAQIRAVEQ